MEAWQAVVLGLVEGVTEYLPVSSTGHLILASALLGLDGPAEKTAIDAFNIVIQGGAIAAVALLYWPRVVSMLQGLAGRDAAGRQLLGCLIVAFLPAALLGPVLDKAIEAHLFHPLPVLAALALGGVWMLWLGRASRAEAARSGLGIDAIDWRRALTIGLFQCLAMWPGTSRSMVTIAGGTLLGLRTSEAAEFSFLLGLPTLGAACAYKLAKNLLAARHGAPSLFDVLGLVPVALGFAVAAVAAFFAVRWLVAFLTRHGLAAFGWYRLALAALLGALIATGAVEIGS